MRIGYLTYALDRAPFGIGRFAIAILRAVAALPQAPEFVLLTTEREDRHGLWKQFEHHSLPGCRLLPSLLVLGHLTVSEAVRRYNLDIIHDPNGIAPFLWPRVRARRIVTLYDAFAFVHPETHNWLDNFRYHWQLGAAARRADAVITVSECSRRDLVRFLNLDANRIHVIPGGVDSRYRPIPDNAARQAVLARFGLSQPYLLYVGGINGRKNIARLFEAYARVRERHPQLTLVIAGKRQWATEDIDAAFRRHNLDQHVQFTGYVTHDDLPALYSAAELFVFPSLYEGFGLPPLEAMACGAPVVTSNTSSLPEVVGDAALTVNPYDIDEIALAIERVLSDEQLRGAMRERGLKRAAQFTWDRAARMTLGLYDRILHGSSSVVLPSAWSQTKGYEHGD